MSLFHEVMSAVHWSPFRPVLSCLAGLEFPFVLSILCLSSYGCVSLCREDVDGTVGQSEASAADPRGETCGSGGGEDSRGHGEGGLGHS